MYDFDFDEFLPETVTIEPFSGVDSHGARSYGAPKTVRGRIEQFVELVRDQTGREVVSQTRIYLKPTATDGSTMAPRIEDRITLPVGYTPQAPPILAVERRNDSDGVHHFEVEA